MKLYEVTDELERVALLLEESGGEWTEEIMDLLKALEWERAFTVDGLCKLIRRLEREKDMIAAELDDLNRKRTSHTRSVSWLKNYMMNEFRSQGTRKVDTGVFKCWIQRNGRPTIRPADPLDPPAQFVRTVYEFDGTKAYEHWKATGEVPGCEVEIGEHLRIK